MAAPGVAARGPDDGALKASALLLRGLRVGERASLLAAMRGSVLRLGLDAPDSFDSAGVVPLAALGARTVVSAALGAAESEGGVGPDLRVDGERLPLASGTVDLVVLGPAACADPILRALPRILRAPGFAVAVVPAGAGLAAGMRAAREWFFEGRVRPRPAAAAMARGALRRRFEAAGMQVRRLAEARAAGERVWHCLAVVADSSADERMPRSL